MPDKADSNTKLSIIRSRKELYSERRTPRVATDSVRLEEPQVPYEAAAREMQKSRC